MIHGTFAVGRGAVIPLLIRGPDGSNLDVDAVIDTGFSGYMTLPASLAEALGLIFKSGGTLVLADGTHRDFDVYIVEIAWDGQWRTVLASALGDQVLVGMRMIDGHRLLIEAVPEGPVEIAPLP